MLFSNVLIKKILGDHLQDSNEKWRGSKEDRK